MAGKDFDDGLTEEERAALADDEDTGDSDSGQDDADDGAAAKESAEAEEKAKADAEAKAEEGATDDDKPAGKTDDPTTVESAPTPQPILIAQAPEDAEAKLKEIADKKDALITQFDEGEITAREYQKQLDALLKDERAIEFDVREAKLAEKLEGQRMQNEWTATCNAFVEANTIYKDNPRLYRALDQEVRELANKPETANWSGQKFLDEAHKALVKAFNLPAGKTSAKPTAESRPDLPPNLAKVPAASVEDTNGGKYAVLDRMANTDPLGYEAALAKMSEADRNAYLAA